MKIYLDNNLGVSNVEQEELTQDTIGYNILKVYIPNAVLTPYDTFTCYYGALLQNGRKVGWFAMEARTNTDADYEANYTLYKATLEQCVVSVEGKVYIGCQVLLGNSGNATLIKKNTAVVQFNVRKSVAINNDILVLDTDQTTTDVLESYKQLLENALTTYATKATTYTKTEVNSALALKADKSDTYTKAQVDSALATKADRDSTDSRFLLIESAIDDLTSVQNVVDVVATKSALNSYDTSKLDVNDKIQVIADETHDSASTIYNWNGSAWQYVGAFGGNSYTKQESDNKFALKSTAVFHSGNQLQDENNNDIFPSIDISTKSANLFNKQFCTIIGYYAYNSGVFNGTATSMRSIDFVKVKPSTTYTINKNYVHISYWNGNGYVGGTTSNSSTNYTFTTSATTEYLKISMNVNQVDSFMLIEGSTLPSAYVQYTETLYPFYKITANNLPDNFITIANLNDDVKNYLMNRIVPTMEIGNIAMAADAWYYNDRNSRARTPQNYYIPLAVGDVIKLTDYSNARMYIGWKVGTKLYNSGAWVTSDFTVSQAGDYIILLSNIAEQALSDVTDLSNLLRVYQFNYLKNQILINQEKNLYEIANRTSSVKSVNHRGYSIGAPENTLPAYKLSKEKGFDYVECDVSFTSDKVPVLLHDDTIDRTSNGTGNINDLTYAYVRTLDFGSWFNPIYAGTKIPSFEEFIVLCKRLGLKPYVEIKPSASYTIDDIKILTDIVKNNGMINEVTWISFSITFLGYVHTLLPKARLGYVVYQITQTEIDGILALKEDNEVFIDEYYVYLTSEIISSLISQNLPLEVYTIDTEDALFAQSNYITGITSNSLNASVANYKKGMNS